MLTENIQYGQSLSTAYFCMDVCVYYKILTQYHGSVVFFFDHECWLLVKPVFTIMLW